MFGFEGWALSQAIFNHLKLLSFSFVSVIESLEEVGSDSAESDVPEFHLLVTSAAETAVVYR